MTNNLGRREYYIALNFCSYVQMRCKDGGVCIMLMSVSAFYVIVFVVNPVIFITIIT
jgi:hypothetical protein